MCCRFLAAFLLCCSAASVRAQDCGCDHEVGLETAVFDARETPVRPGDRICVMAGEREFLRFRHVQGTAEAPVTVLNCGGVVRIHNDDRAYALVFEDDSQHFHVTGTGDESLTYGFDISAPDEDPYPGIGLWLLGRSTNYEADHMEIHDTGFAGVSAKTDPVCDGSADQDAFVQRDARLHHLYVHDTGGEGFYVGSTQANGQRITCDGNQETRFPHFLDGIEIHDNRIENTGWDGMQVGMARTGCRVYRNTIRNVGLRRVEFQEQGLQIGDYSSCEIFGNVIEDGPANGIIMLGAGDTFVHSNLIRGFTMADGIYANLRDRVPGARYRYAFNTIVGWDRAGITVFGAMLGASSAHSNVLIGEGDGVGAGGDVDWTASNNLTFADLGAAGLGDDLRPAASSVVVGAGASVEGVTHDLDGYPRSEPPSAGAYEYRDPSVDAGPPRFDAGAGGSTDAGPPPPRTDGGAATGDDAGTGTGEGGCSVSARDNRGAALVWIVGLAIWTLRRRRGRRG